MRRSSVPSSFPPLNSVRRSSAFSVPLYVPCPRPAIAVNLYLFHTPGWVNVVDMVVGNGNIYLV